MAVDEIDGEDWDYKLKAESICHSSSLSVRESELYVLTEVADFSVPEAAEKMGISKGNAYGKVDRIRKKIGKAEKTAELSI